MPSRPSPPRSRATLSVGNVPASKCSATIGRNFSRTYERTVSRIIRSSSSSWAPTPSGSSGSNAGRAGAVTDMPSSLALLGSRLALLLVEAAAEVLRLPDRLGPGEPAPVVVVVDGHVLQRLRRRVRRQRHRVRLAGLRIA